MEGGRLGAREIMIDDYPEAARKHLVDAKALATAQRFDGAAYLSGYVVECTAKALIQVETGQSPKSHDLGKLREVLDDQVGVADTRTGRLGLQAAACLGDAQIMEWQTEMRYRRPHVSAEQAETWLDEATAIYDVVIGEMSMDGLIG